MTDVNLSITDEDLDAVETRRLVAALARRHHSLIVGGMKILTDKTFDMVIEFLPNEVACVGLMQTIDVTFALKVAEFCSSMRQSVLGEKAGASASEI